MTKPRAKAWLPPKYTIADVHAVKALARGEATADQQKRALDWIVHAAAGAYELSFRSDGDGGERETAFAEGRRFVGMQVVKLVNMPGAVLRAIRSKDDGNAG